MDIGEAYSGVGGGAARVAPERPRRILILCAGVRLAYRVVRCVAAAGCEAYALGPRRSSGLAFSRFCRFGKTEADVDGAGCEALLRDINRYVARWSIDLVLAGDAPSTRSLIVLKDRVAAPCFPMPDLAAFDLLDNKWEFGRLCVAAGVRTPATRLFASPPLFEAALRSGSLPARLMAKPLRRSGGEGCIMVEPGRWRDALSRIDYAPILAQEFIDGEDLDASVFCRKGSVDAVVCYTVRRATYRTCVVAEVRDEVERLFRRLAVDGVFNFDLRRDRSGRLHFIECNPRFYYSMAMSMLGGVNFVSLGLGAEAKALVHDAPKTVRSLKALLLAALTPWKIEAESWNALRFTLADPLPALREAIGLEKR